MATRHIALLAVLGKPERAAQLTVSRATMPEVRWPAMSQ